MEFVPHPTQHNFIPLEGNRYGRLTVIGYLGKIKNKTSWRCLCDCGNYTNVLTTNLKRNTFSCGCLNSELTTQKNTIHGKNRTPEHNSYCNAIARCTNVKHPKYPIYGGRGIQFLFEDFESFYAEVGNKPGKEYSIDRIDVNGHYEVGNVRWATPKQQANNRRNSPKNTDRASKGMKLKLAP
jgi:hypothetical protein